MISYDLEPVVGNVARGHPWSSNTGYGTTNIGYGTTNADARVGIGMKKGGFENFEKKKGH